MTECYTLLYYVREIESVKIILGCFLLIAGPSDRTASRRLGVICRRYLYLGEKNTRERRPRRGRSVTEEILPRRITKKGTNISKKERKFIFLPLFLETFFYFSSLHLATDHLVRQSFPSLSIVEWRRCLCSPIMKIMKTLIFSLLFRKVATQPNGRDGKFLLRFLPTLQISLEK